MQHLFVLACPNPTQALELRDALVSLQGESLLSLDDAVVATRDEEGKVRLHQTVTMTTGSASAGSVIGLIVGIAFLQPWVGTLAGATAGSIVGALLDYGIDDRFMKDLATTIRPGTAAVFLLGRNVQLDAVKTRVGPLLSGCTILRSTVNSDREAEVRRWLEGT